jgi:hypothetical protein
MLEYNGQTGSTPAHGAWKYSGRGEFEGAWFRFAYDPQGAVLVLIKGRSRLRMVSDNEYTNQVKIEVYGTNGQILTAWTNTSVGQRIVVEPID